jgi:hypothetical protein
MCVCAGGWLALKVGPFFPRFVWGGFQVGLKVERKHTGELEAGPGVVEGSPTFLKKAAIYCLPCQGSGVCAPVYCRMPKSGSRYA